MQKLLVTTEWLNDNLYRDDLRIIDIRGRVAPASEPLPHYFSHYSDYLKSHIPNAVFVDWTKDIVDAKSPSYDIAPPEQFAALMGQLGVASSTQVIVYDDAGGMFASRLWWSLNYYGHEAVAIVDGGWQKWVAESRPITDEISRTEARVFEPIVQTSWRATADDILGNPSTLLDVRSISEYNGQSSRASRAGHIPDAVNLPRKQLLNDDGTLISSQAIHTILTEIGINVNDDNPVVYCNSGVSASFVLLALRHVGLQTGRVYDGSWKEWGNNPNRPIETFDS